MGDNGGMPHLSRVVEHCLVLGLAGLALATVATWLARFGWPFELFAHFAPQLTIAAALIALASLFTGRVRWAGFAVLLLVAHALPWWRSVHDEPAAAACGTPDIRLVTANLAYRNRDHDAFLAWLEANPADVVVVQELTPAWADALERTRAGYPYRHLLARDDAYGVAVLSRWPLESVATLDLAQDGLPSLGFVVRAGTTRLRVLGMHTHWPLTPALQRMRDRSLELAARQVREQALPTVLAGDLNLTPYAPAFGRLLRASGLRDAFATRAWRATWTAGFWPLALPIDHVLLPAGACVRATTIGPDIGSDHRPVHVTFGWPDGRTAGPHSAARVSPVGGANSRQQSTSQARKRTTFGSEKFAGGATRNHALRCCTLGSIGRTRRPAAMSAATSDQRASATPLPCSTAARVAVASSVSGAMSVRVVSPPTRRSQSGQGSDRLCSNG